MSLPPAKKRRLMGRLQTIEPMEVDPPESDVEPMEVDLVSDEEPMEIDPPPSGQNYHHAIALRRHGKRPRPHPYLRRESGSCPPPPKRPPRGQH